MRNDGPTIIATPGCSLVDGMVAWAPRRSVVWFAMVGGAVLALTRYASWRVRCVFENMGWVGNVTVSAALPSRDVLQALEEDAERVPRTRAGVVSL